MSERRPGERNYRDYRWEYKKLKWQKERVWFFILDEI